MGFRYCHRFRRACRRKHHNSRPTKTEYKIGDTCRAWRTTTAYAEAKRIDYKNKARFLVHDCSSHGCWDGCRALLQRKKTRVVAFDHYAWRSPSSVIPNLRTSSKCSMCLIRFLFCLFSAMSNWLQCEYMIAHHTTSTTFMLEYSNSQDLFMVGLHVRYCMRVFEGWSLLKMRRTWRYVPIPVIVSSLIILYTLTRLNQSETLMLAYLSML